MVKHIEQELEIENRPSATTADADADAWLSYDADIRKALSSVSSAVGFPDGSAFNLSYRESELVHITGFTVSKLMYFMTVYQTSLVGCHVNDFVENAIRFACVADGISVDTFSSRCLESKTALQYLTKVIRIIPSILMYTTQNRARDYVLVANEQPNISRAALDCRELSSMCALMARYISNSDSKLTLPLRTQLAKYQPALLSCSTTAMDGNPGLHLLFTLVPKTTIRRLESDAKFNLLNDSKEEAPEPPVCIIDSASQMTSTWDESSYNAPEEEKPFTRTAFLKPRIRMEYVASRMIASAMCLYVLSETASECRQLFLVQKQRTPIASATAAAAAAAADSKWSFGVPFSDFCRGLKPDIGLEIQMWRPVTPTAKQLESGIATLQHVKFTNTVRFNPRYVTLTTERVSRLAALSSASAEKSTFIWVLFRKADVGISLKNRLDMELKCTNATRTSNKSKKLTCEIKYEETEYAFDGLEDVSLLLLSEK